MPTVVKIVLFHRGEARHRIGAVRALQLGRDTPGADFISTVPIAGIHDLFHLPVLQHDFDDTLKNWFFHFHRGC